MNVICGPAHLSGTVPVPGSKSHTIRAIAIAALAPGESRIDQPLDSADTRAAVAAYRALGAHIDDTGDDWTITGTGGTLTAPADPIDVGNSGTTLRLAMGSAALLRDGTATLTGDDQIRRRPAAPLAQSLTDLGARARSLNGSGCAPFEVAGRLRGGETTIEAVTSQYLSSLLIATPLADGDSHIRVPLLNERPYVHITLDWLERQGVRVDGAAGLSEFRVPGGQTFQPVRRRIPGDFSSATFFLCAGAMPGNRVTCEGLDMADTQGDKAIVDYLQALGARVEVDSTGVTVEHAALRGCELDLNATPDALPMLAALACLAKGETRLVNVPQARMKETDRIAVMREELTKLGADIEELPDGLVIRESTLHGVDVNGHGDHRVVMALAILATAIPQPTTIHGAHAIRVTYPAFLDHLTALGATATKA